MKWLNIRLDDEMADRLRQRTEIEKLCGRKISMSDITREALNYALNHYSEVKT